MLACQLPVFQLLLLLLLSLSLSPAVSLSLPLPLSLPPPPSVCLFLSLLVAPGAARMRRPWESEEDFAHNTRHGITSRTPPKGWGRPGGDKAEVLFPGFTDEARAHCTKSGQQSDTAERSAACLLAQHGFLAQIDAFTAAGYLAAQDLAGGDFTCAAFRPALMLERGRRREGGREGWGWGGRVRCRPLRFCRPHCAVA